jgi:hypothetical protein
VKENAVTNWLARRRLGGVFTSVFLAVAVNCVYAEVIDPEKHIAKYGFHTTRMGDDGRTKFYDFTEKISSSLISTFEQDIADLPKDSDVFKLCDFIRGGVKAKLIAERGKAFDVAVADYGYSGVVVACSLKYMHENSVGTQLIFAKKGTGGMYMVFVTD